MKWWKLGLQNCTIILNPSINHGYLLVRLEIIMMGAMFGTGKAYSKGVELVLCGYWNLVWEYAPFSS